VVPLPVVPETAGDASIPRRIGKYELLLPLGTGGMATVYLAKAEVVPGVARQYAVKLMHAHLRGDPDWALHLLHEAQVAARIGHPNVVQVLEAGDDPIGVFLVLDYVEGDSLSGFSRALAKRGASLPLPMSGRILLDALAGLHAAHELRDDSGAPLDVVHRDFSPQNILVGTDGVGRLTDFGIAKAGGGQATATGVLKGKVSYMSPEQARGQRVDRRCDVWAAGVIAWELLANRRLYPKRNEAETLLAVIQGSPPRLTEVNPKVPPELDEVIAHALTPDVDRRCPDIRTFSERLETAWRAYVGLADAGAIGALVEDAISESLLKRRQAARQELPTPSSHEPSGDSLVLAPQTTVDLEGPTDFQFMTQARRRGLTRGAGGVVALLGVASVTALWLRGKSEQPSEELVTSAPAPAPAVPSPSADGGGVQHAVSLTVRANTKIARVRVGRRSVEVVPPATTVDVALLGAEQASVLPVEVTSESGVTVTREVGADEGSVSVRFDDPPRPKGGVAPRAKPRPVDELAPTPFKK